MGAIDKVAAWIPTVIYRNEPIHDSYEFPQMEVLSVPPDAHAAPQPVPATAYSGVGRDQAHAPTPIRTYQAPAFAEWLTVMGWPFAVAKVPSALVVSMPRGRANPIRSRVNIDNPPQASLGGLTTLSGVQSYPRDLAKITF